MKRPRLPLVIRGIWCCLQSWHSAANCPVGHPVQPELHCKGPGLGAQSLRMVFLQAVQQRQMYPLSDCQHQRVAATDPRVPL